MLIRRVWLEDPLLCPDCGSEMGILSFITEPVVVDRIQLYPKWRPGEALLPHSWSPLSVLKVAEPLSSTQSPRQKCR